MKKIIPNSFNVGGIKMNVNIVDKLPDGILGNCCLAKSTVNIARTYMDSDGIYKQSEESMTNTFYHELTHNILDTMAEFDLSKNEKFVSTFSSFLNEALGSMQFDEENNIKKRYNVE